MTVYKTKTRAPLMQKKGGIGHLNLPTYPTRFIGIDQSLSCTGVVCCDLKMRIKQAFCIPTNPDSLNEARIDWVGSSISSLLRVEGKQLHFVALERPAYAGSGQRDVLHGVYWEIRRRVYRYNPDLDIKLIAISSWKKFIAGNGRATKTQVKRAIERKYGHEFNDENIYDAYGLLRYAVAHWRKKHG